jgi:hypothetical protein
MKHLHMTREQAEEHQRKHGFWTPSNPLEITPSNPLSPRPKRSMTKPEREYSLILEAQKRRREILWYQFEGMRLKWGVDPKTGAAMWYKPDFCTLADSGPIQLRTFTQHDISPIWTMIEVKGPWINPRDMVRFKGCRAAWPMFDFEMHQRDREGRWTRIQ